MNNDFYWVALQNVLGYASSRSLDFMQHFDDISQLFAADDRTVKAARIFTPAEFLKFKNVDFDKAKKTVEHCNKSGYVILTPENEQYPKRLLRIKNPPAVLYADGELPDMEDEVGITMVGTRSCTKNGLIVASVLSYRLAEAGAVIISGGAMGIDTACSQGAVAVHRKSIIVLGCGFDYPYLLSNRKIRDEVRSNGALITEYQPDFAPSKYTFPQRNRIMSALSNGVVLIEAPENSGALITVNFALEQGKDIYVLPGDITNKNYVGNNRLLQDGATPIYTPKDVLCEYMPQFPHKLSLKNCDIPLAEDRLFINMYNKNRGVADDRYINRRAKYTRSAERSSAKLTAAEPKSKYGKNPQKTEQNSVNKEPENMFVLPELQFDADEIVKKVYNCFTNNAASVDILIQKSGLPAGDVLYALTELEMNGAADALPGGMYAVKSK